MHHSFKRHLCLVMCWDTSCSAKRCPRPSCWGGILIIGGTLLLSVGSEHHKTRYKGRLIFLMLACAFSLALSSVIFKLFAIRDEYWTTTFWTFVGEAVFGLGLLAVTTYRSQFFALLRSNTAAVLTLNGANELINLGGGLGMRYAFVLAPLSLVQAIGSTSSLLYLYSALRSLYSFPLLGGRTCPAEISCRRVFRQFLSCSA